MCSSRMLKCNNIPNIKVLGKKGVTFFRGACNFLIKHLKSEIFNDKKSLSR